MTKEQFIAAKTEIAKKALPHLVDPDGYGPANLTPAECSLLTAPDEKRVASTAQILKLERSAKEHLATALRSMGYMSVADVMPVRRG